MKSPFYNDIYEILQSKGQDGLPVGIIAKQVYNRHVGLFNSGFSYDWLYQYIRFYLWAQAGKPSSPFVRGSKWGWYSLSRNACKQLHLHFEQAQTETPEEPLQRPMPNNEPTLFD